MTNVLRLAMGDVEFPELLSRKEVLNRRQCENLLSNFQKGVEVLQNITKGPVKVFHEAQKDLFRIVHKGRVLVEECCSENWVHATVMQVNNEEWFRGLLSDFEYCFHTLCDISCHYNPHEKQRILAIEHDTTFYPASIDVVIEDQYSMCQRLSDHLGLCTTKDCKDCELAQYLVGYLRSLQGVEGGELDNIVVPYNYPRPEYGHPRTLLGDWDGGGVYLTKWMGLECATKVISIHSREDANEFWKEASILGGLNHPNIIKFFCCGFHEPNNQFELVMELGMTTLSKYLKPQGQPKVLTEMHAVDIILQIASGMCYLHDMKVAHRDLKPTNVVVISSNDSQLVNSECIHVKLSDFGISKVEVKDPSEVPIGQSKMGSFGYMAPEAMANELLEVDALKADVFSFGMMCSDILSGEKPCFGRFGDYLEYLQESKRPKLLGTYSEVLRSLVDECWSSHPSERPTFLDIHRRLVRLKSTVLKGSLEIVEVTNDTNGSNWKVLLSCFLSSIWQRFLKWIQWLCFVLHPHHFDNSTLISSIEEKCNERSSYPLLIKVNDNNMREPSKLIGVQEKMSQLEKQLQMVGSLGIVGMGGIGKSTLAKALSDHISHHFDAVCFVINLKDETCTFALKHKSRDMQDSPPQVKMLRKTRRILEGVRETMKILLVVDGVSKQSQLHQLLGNGMFKDVDGMKLIASSRDWNSLKQHVPMAGKVDMQTLEGNQPMRLFSRHAFETNQSCLPYLKHVAEKIVDACCGLPLSLEVMGTCLQGKTRLRIWERTLHRLLRSRHDGSAEEKLWKALRISFDELSGEEKNMFLDIACFFCKDVSTTKETFLRMLDGNAREILEGLHNKSLVNVDKWDRLDMHNQLRDMGRMISEKEFEGSRLLDFNYLEFANHCKRKGTKLVEGLSFRGLERKPMYEIDIEFKPMEKLHILNVQSCNDIGLLLAIVKKTPNLNCLRVHFSTLMEENDFIKEFWNHAQHYLPKLRVLEVFNCNFSGSLLCESSKVMPLKSMTLSDCKNIESFLNEVSKFSNLESLNISRCTNLENIPQGLANLCTLEELDFSKCRSLTKILGGFNCLTNLKKLHMWECEALEEFPLGLTNLIALEELDFSKCRSLKKIPGGLIGLTSLKKLHMWECEALEEFPPGLTNLSALLELDLSKCRFLRWIPEGFGSLTSLKQLDMWECEALGEFPSGLIKLCALEELNFSRCRSLRRIPEGFGGLTSLKKLVMWECEALVEFPHGLTNLRALEELNFSQCRSLGMIPEGFDGLTSLKKLNMGGCETLEFPSGLTNVCTLEELSFVKCLHVKIIPEGFGGLTRMKKLDMSKCEALEEFPLGLTKLFALEELNFSECRSLRSISEGFGGLISLKKLDMSECEALEEFPLGMTGLYALEELNFSQCRSLRWIPEGFGGLTSLKKLDMWECEGLGEFPLGLTSLCALEELNCSKCRCLRWIPDGFGGLTSLKKLDMSECEALEEFPVGLTNLSALEELNFSECWSLRKIPEGFGGLTSLKRLYMWGCSQAVADFPLGSTNLCSLEEFVFLKCRSSRKIHEGFGDLEL